MTQERYQQLIGLLFDGELSDDEARELSAAIGSSPELRTDLHEHLILWELWSQQQAPERSATAFFEGWKTRFSAENGAEVFNNSVLSRLSRHTPIDGLLAKAFSWAAPLSARLRETAHWLISSTFRLIFASSMAAAALVCLVWFAIPRSAQAVTLTGEGVCTACILHLTHTCSPALRVTSNGSQKIYFLHATDPKKRCPGGFCSAPVPIVVKGTLSEKSGHSELEILDIRRLPVTLPAPHK